MESFQYGVFRLGQIWTVADQNGARFGFPSRAQAIAALQAMIAQSSPGAAVSIAVQDNGGRLRTLADPASDLPREAEACETAWGLLMGLDAKGRGSGGHVRTGDG